jgi:phage tail sheath protein FI
LNPPNSGGKEATMPVTTSFPGVYIEELQSPVHTITGVATSITAFVGRALRGPVNQALLINSFADYQRIFGGLWSKSTLGFCVNDFYMNGGTQALVVRLYTPFFASDEDRAVALAAANAVVSAATGASVAEAVTNAENAFNALSGSVAIAAGKVVLAAVHAAAAATSPTVQTVKAAASAAVPTAVPTTRARLVVGTSPNQLTLEAASEGAWGNNLRARVDHLTKESNAPNGTLFNLSIKEMGTGRIEVLRNLSVSATDTRAADKVLKQESQLVRVTGALPPARPDKSADPATAKDPFDLPSATGASTLASDGSVPGPQDYQGDENGKTGIYALKDADLFNLLCVPPRLDDVEEPVDIDTTTLGKAAKLCQDRRALLLVDAPTAWTDKDKAQDASTGIASLSTACGASANAAVFFPWILEANPLHEGRIESFVPCGAVAGVIARTDARRGVWKAPAGLEATLTGALDVGVRLTDQEIGELNPKAINCIRPMPASGNVIWGARTLRGDDRLSDQWKYIPVRRLALYIEESLYRGTQWVVFEPNDEPLWSQIRLNVGSFMHRLFRQGAFQGSTPQQAYLVKCDRETTTPDDINRGVVNIVVGFAPLKPAEFVIIQIQQLAGQVET